MERYVPLQSTYSMFGKNPIVENGFNSNLKNTLIRKF